MDPGTALKRPGFTDATKSLNCLERNQSYRPEWTPVPNADGYELQRVGNDGNRTVKNDYETLAKTSTHFFTLHHETLGRRFLRVRAWNKQGQKSPWSEVLIIDVVNRISLRNSHIPAPEAIRTWWLPERFIWPRDSMADCASVQLAWQSSAIVQRYQVEKKSCLQGHIETEIHRYNYTDNIGMCQLEPGEHDIRVCALGPHGAPNHPWSTILHVIVSYENNRLTCWHVV